MSPLIQARCMSVGRHFERDSWSRGIQRRKTTGSAALNLIRLSSFFHGDNHPDISAVQPTDAERYSRTFDMTVGPSNPSINPERFDWRRLSCMESRRQCQDHPALSPPFFDNHDLCFHCCLPLFLNLPHFLDSSSCRDRNDIVCTQERDCTIIWTTKARLLRFSLLT